jgi:hypothetical protein
VRLAVAEASAILLDEIGPTTLRMEIRREAGGLDVRISCDGTADPWPPDDAASSWPWLVVQGLTDDARLDRDGDGGPAVGFVKRSERVPR